MDSYEKKRVAELSYAIEGLFDRFKKKNTQPKEQQISLDNIDITYYKMDPKKAYTEWYISWLIDTDELDDFCMRMSRFFAEEHGAKITKYATVSAKEFNREYGLRTRGIALDKSKMYVILPTYSSEIKAATGSRYFTDVVDNKVRQQEDEDPRYVAPNYIYRENIDTARQYLATH